MSDPRAPLSQRRGRASVRRDRLLDALDRVADWRVALVRARAGAGKTTALRDWVSERGAPAAYVELSTDHDDPARLLGALARALAVAELPPHDDPNAAVAALLERAPPEVPLLVIDAVERIHETRALEVLDALVRATTGARRIVLSGRAVPRLRELAVLRVHEDLIDVDEGQLRLDEQEASELYELLCGEADVDAARAILALSEGWVAGFSLIAKERRRRPTRSIDECLETAIPAIRDFLFDDVIDRLPAQLAELLLDMSVLDPFTAAVADAIRARNDSARLLRELERESLFLDRIRSEPGWLRMHALVRSVVEDELAITDAERHRTLHNRAARWSRGQGDEVGAMRHLVAGGDLDGAWKRFSDHWAERYFAGDFATVGGWCDLLAANAQLDVERASELATALLMLGRLTEAEHFVIEASLVLDASDEPNSACLELARFLHAYSRGALDVALHHAALACESFAGEGPSIWRRARASLALASALGFAGRNAEAEIEMRRAFAEEDPASPVDAVVFPAARARLALLSADLLEAEEEAMRSLEAASLLKGDSEALLCEALGSIGFVELERNELVAAERDLVRAIEHADAIGYAPVRIVARLTLARVHQARGHGEDALATVAACRRLSGTRLDHHFADRIAEAEAHLRLCHDDGAGALACLPPERRSRLRLTEARALAALGDHAGALALAAEVDVTNPYRAVRVHLVEARSSSDAEARRRRLVDAIEIAEASGFTRLLLDERVWLLEHLHALVPLWPTDFVSAIVERSVQELAIRTPADRLARLSDRELEVWRHLSTPLSLSEISRRLFISRNTMKTHVRNIYRKLEVASRDAAVAVASAPPEAERSRRQM